MTSFETFFAGRAPSNTQLARFIDSAARGGDMRALAESGLVFGTRLWFKTSLELQSLTTRHSWCKGQAVSTTTPLTPFSSIFKGTETARQQWGFFAWENPDLLLGIALTGDVYGISAHWGEIHFHQRGLRSQYCYPVVLNEEAASFPSAPIEAFWDNLMSTLAKKERI